MKKGVCKRRSLFQGLVRVSGKGQVAIPAGLRHDLAIKTGDRLVVLLKEDETGSNCI